MKIKGKLRFRQVSGLLAVVLSLMLLAGTGWAQSLKTVPVPEPFTLFDYVVDKNAAIQLGKILFWDMQLGSDGVQSCASCHFHAGADNRNRNQMNPGILAGSSTFTPPDAPNSTLTTANFPFHKLSDPDNANSTVLRSNPDVCSSQGIKLAQFVDIKPGSAVEISSPLIDPIWNLNLRGRRVNVRRVEPRNTPTVINAAYNFAQFWDGRANNIFNGVNPFGPNDANAKVFFEDGAGLKQISVQIVDGSLASQAVGPPLSDFEMSFRGRTWPKIGKKMLSLPPLAKQSVHPRDSVLGTLAKSTINLSTGQITFIPGLITTYEALIQRAFASQWWNNSTQMVTYAPDGTPTISPRPPGPLNTNQFTMMEANFCLFFGLAVQLYEATLIADDTPFDRFLDGFTVNLTQQQQRGLANFIGEGCTVCHGFPETTEASSIIINAGAPRFPFTPPLGAIELMPTGNRQPAFYDTGWFNTAVTPSAADPGRDGTAPFINPDTGAQYPLSYSKLCILKKNSLLPSGYALLLPILPIGNSVPPDRAAVNGSFKASQLRNIELTGPYMHNGSIATLHQVMDFYTRGGNFADNNIVDLDPVITPLGGFMGLASEKNEVVALMLGMTDERVRNESAPFDHPELIVPHGNTTTGADITFRVPPVGAGGRAAEGLPPLQPFLNVNQFLPNP